MLKRSILTILLIATCFCISAQENIRKLSLNEVIDLARDQSFQAILARHQFMGSYWEYRSYKAHFLPSLTMNSGLVNFNHSISKYQKQDGSYKYIDNFDNTTDLEFSLSQNIGLTGGSIFVNSSLQRTDDFGNELTSYLSNPVNFGVRQPINGYNRFKWERKIEPLKYEQAQKEYVSAMEDVSLRAINLFFDLALAQVNLKVARLNYSQTDTLFKISQGRYQIGTISQNELLQMELSYLQADQALNEAKIALEDRKIRLRSFLGFNEKVDFELHIPDSVPDIKLQYDQVYQKARDNNPELMDYERRMLEGQRNLQQAKAEKGLNADLFASFGLTQKTDTDEIPLAYKDPRNYQRVSLGLELPILDWGRREGQFRMAQSQMEVIRTSVKQNRIDFERNVFLDVMRFNLLDEQFLIARKADTIAQMRYDVARNRFLIGKIDVLDLNIALQDKDNAKRRYIQALKDFWTRYYQIRRLTLYDFADEEELTGEVEEKLIE